MMTMQIKSHKIFGAESGANKQVFFCLSYRDYVKLMFFEPKIFLKMLADYRENIGYHFCEYI
jgi:hypothetical protein